MKIMTVLGARPQFVKAAAVSGLLRARHTECLVHTGQHFEPQMSDVFFRDLDIPAPDYDLGVSGGSQAEQVGMMMIRLEKVMDEEKPRVVLVYGDTNSTLAGALVASEKKIPVIHVEAGLRSFDRTMPEEINRVIVDRISSVLFAPTNQAVKNLFREGRSQETHLVGDVMFDIFKLYESKIRRKDEDFLSRLGLSSKGYGLLTIHRQANVDDRKTLRTILEGLSLSGETFLFPVHPRTRQVLGEVIFDNVIKEFGKRLKRVEPLGYLEFLGLAAEAKMIVTDSGGLQKEAMMLSVPCVTIRSSTEWTETVDYKWNKLVAAQTDLIRQAVKNIKSGRRFGSVYGDGHAAEKIIEIINREFGS